jgi:hypothetical protein
MPDATLARLDSNAGHVVAADSSRQLADISSAIGEFLVKHAGCVLGDRDAVTLAALLDRAKGEAHFRSNSCRLKKKNIGGNP